MERQFDDILLGSIELFCLAAEHGSFTSAANAAGITPAAVSRSIARLEERLGVRLFARTTRRISLTEGGQGYYERCRSALGQLAEAERALSGQQAVPAGRLRVSLPTTYGHFRVLPWLAEFRARYPEVELDLHLSNRNIDFSSGGFDLAVRAREPADSTLIARRLENADLVVVASPAYLERHGRPLTPDVLVNHECIQFERPSTGRHVPWLFKLDGEVREVVTHGHLICSEDVLAGVTLARHGAGLYQTHRYIVAEDLEEGRLVEVLKEWGGCSRPFHLIYPHGRHLPLRVRVFIDFLLEKAQSGM